MGCAPATASGFFHQPKLWRVRLLLHRGVGYTIERQLVAQFRQALAHATICGSDSNFSHSAAHASHAFAHAVQAAEASEHERAMICVDKLQNSWQLIAIAAQAACSFIPLAKCVMQ
ncbi:hypothetical protein RBWH47_02930 [Rhodopirellula baltica WH47]|uniref:Uncharacterized protein n=1 Tax=Rhodopirellula baltica WH47 TaxID=991778 RepID=F2B133_RHOBT|nr:hypothetical protein RBWH47_02930 [Rhodopirellula baltica WH47]